MTDEVVDFRKPGRVSEDIGHMLSQWQQRVREALEFRWGRCIPSGVKVGLTPPAPLTGGELRLLDESSITYRVDVVETGHPTLFVINRPLALAIVKDMLGDAVSELPEDRELTDIEFTCLDYVIDELKTALQASQQLTPARKLQLVGRAQLKELHDQFPKNVTNTDVGFKIELPFGGDTLRWILPQDVTLDMVASSASQDATNGKARKDLERLVLSVPADLSVRLGGARVQLSRLASLKPGDIIRLDQRIEDPLIAQLGGQRLFYGWGSRIGKQQGFQIDQVLDAQLDK